ncbi:zinc finger Y-chromosomal protein 1-like isoform X2 [Sitophilus oryzae]|uniref:Zinc finger Y-chromosomal protein 1-like isoform X2 n=1 Tax=Sitophilus oryzae TaxID=7048 RepID=A0A6J2YKI6_SITOR|nr:zinc finger Y-chromosomal protein 1-like isoform X2 [Sitophilus oryzae]
MIKSEEFQLEGGENEPNVNLNSEFQQDLKREIKTEIMDIEDTTESDTGDCETTSNCKSEYIREKIELCDAGDYEPTDNPEYIKVEQTPWNLKDHNKHFNETGDQSLLPKHHQCTLCGFKTHLIATYKKHYNEHVSNQEKQTYDCYTCGAKYYAKRYLKKHIFNTHRTSKYSCTKCDFKTSKKKYFQTHDQVHQAPDKAKKNKCTHCGYQFTSSYTLRRHVSIFHTTQVYYNCTQCDFKTIHEKSLQYHVLVHGAPKLQCPHCNNKYLKQSLKKHIKMVHQIENYYLCRKCSFSTTDISELNQHGASHLRSDAKKVKCSLCDYHYVSRKTFRKHLQTTHGILKYYFCRKSECNYEGTDKEQYEEHLLTHQQDILKYQCEICLLVYREKKHLDRHMILIHKNLNFYSCSKCDFKSKKKQTLLKHRAEIHHLDEEFKCFLCDFVGSRQKYSKHVFTHKTGGMYECKICDFLTKDVQYLKKHFLTKKHLASVEATMKQEKDT